MPRTVSLLVLLAGGLALMWGGATLQEIFVEERDSAREAIALRRRALEQYALIELQKRLAAELSDARPRMDAALADPLLAEPGLLVVEDGAQLLPPLIRYREGSDTPARQLHGELEAGAVSAEGPWGERLALLEELRRALDRADGEAITAAVRSFLNHQSRFLVAVTKDLPYRLHFLETFMEGTTPDRSLLQALLRDGLRGTRGHRLVGLQPLLLSHRERFSRADFEFLAGRISALSRRARVIHDDFDLVAAQPSDEAVPVPEALEGPALLGNGAWYAVPLETRGIRGIAVDLAAMLREIGSEMQGGGLLGSEDTLSGEPSPGEIVAPSDFPVTVRSPSFEAEATEIQRRYALKTATGIALGMLVVGVALLIGLLYRRERKLLEAKAGFVATVSHELRTPLASLRLMGETLERRLEGAEAARDFPSRIVGEAERLSFLVENILSFNRLEKANVRAHLQNVTIGELVEGVRADGAAFTKKPVALRIAGGEDVVLRADPELMRLLLSNLVHNSCKYNDRDAVEIQVAAAIDGRRRIVTFTDNGTGIPRGEWESIFTEFVRARNDGESGGFGLGLALCRRIMELHDGTIRVAASAGGGTTFELVLPGDPAG